MKRIVRIAVCLLLICPSLFGQSSYMGLTPGTSTARDVERVLGPPVRKNNPTEDGTITFEYKPLAGIAKIEVDYSDGSAFAEVIRIYFLKPIARSALLQEFKLPQQADVTGTHEQGWLKEYFGDQALLGLGYASGEATIGVNRVVYFSKEQFTRNVHAEQGKPDVPSLNANITWLRFFNDNAQGVAQKNPDKRVYQSRFSKAQTDRVAWELRLDFPAPGRKIGITYQRVVHFPDGSYKKGPEGTFQIEADKVGFVLPSSWEAKSIDPGIYHVEYLINGEHVATASFEIY